MNRTTKMTRLLLMLALSVSLLIPLMLEAKSTAPVTIDYSVPETVVTGETVSTLIRFVATTDLKKLEISVSAYEGLNLLSKKENTVFFDLTRGESREIEVEIQLTDPEVGYLSVFAKTETIGNTSTKTIAIPYGTAGALTKQKLKANNRSFKHSEGEELILMPGDPR